MPKEIKILKKGDILFPVKIIDNKVYYYIYGVAYMYIGVLEDKLTWFKESEQPDLGAVDTVICLSEGVYGIRQKVAILDEYVELDVSDQCKVLSEYVKLTSTGINTPLPDESIIDGEHCGTCGFRYQVDDGFNSCACNYITVVLPSLQ